MKILFAILGSWCVLYILGYFIVWSFRHSNSFGLFMLAILGFIITLAFFKK